MTLKSRMAASGAALMVLAAAAGCGGGSSSGGSDSSPSSGSGSTNPPEYRVGVAIPSLANPYYVAVKSGMDAAAKRTPGVKLVYNIQSLPSADGAQQIAAINALVTKQVKGLIVVDPLPQTKPALTHALGEHIPLVFVDYDGTGIDPSKATTVLTDTSQAAALAGSFIVKALGGKGNVALLDGFPTAPTNYARTQGAVKVMEDGGIKVVGRATTECDRQKGIDATQNLLTAHPEINLIYAACADPILAAATVLKREGKLGKIKLVGFDAQPREVENMKKGIELASAAQFPAKMGYLSVQAIVEAISTGRVPADIDSGSVLVTKGNASTATSNQIPEK